MVRVVLVVTGWPSLTVAGGREPSQNWRKLITKTMSTFWGGSVLRGSAARRRRDKPGTG